MGLARSAGRCTPKNHYRAWDETNDVGNWTKAEEAGFFGLSHQTESPMSHQRLPPPEPPCCLTKPRVSRYKGGTLIAEDVVDLDSHLRKLADPDGYRPETCPRCGWNNSMHVHDYPTREPDKFGKPVRIVRYWCANPSCGATWRILPAFLPRHLHRPWLRIERAVDKDKPVAALDIPATTVRRWRSRMACAAKQLVVLIATSGGALLEAIAKAVGLGSTRAEFVDAYVDHVKPDRGRRLGEVAALVHRLERGIRLM